MKIDLSHFIDQTDPLLIKGRLTSSGLTSAMSNPLISKSNSDIDFRNQTIFSTSMRDYPFRGRYDFIRGDFLADGFGDDLGSYDDDGYSATKDDTATSTNFLFNTYAYSLVESKVGCDYMKNASKMMYLVAFKTKDLPFSSSERYRSYAGIGRRTTTTSYDSVIEFNRVSSSDNRISLSWRHGSTIDAVMNGGQPVILGSSSANKWHLMQLCLDTETNTATFRILGGEFDSVITVNKAVSPTNGDWNFRYIFVPFLEQFKTAFATVTTWTGNNDAGQNGLSLYDVEWKLFDEEHECNSYDVNGNRIEFSCSGEVAFDILVDDVWCNEIGAPLNGSNRVFHDSGSSFYTPSFTSVRPVLKNTGLLNADDISILHNVDVYDVPQYTLTTNIVPGNAVLNISQETYYENTVVNLVATLDSGYRVLSWSGTDNNSSTSTTNTVTMTSDKVVTLNTVPEPKWINIGTPGSKYNPHDPVPNMNHEYFYEHERMLGFWIGYPESGSELHDFGPNENNLQFNTTPSWSRYEHSYYGTEYIRANLGSNQYLQCASSDFDFTGDKEFTVCMCFTPTPAPVGDKPGFISYWNNYSTGNGWSIGWTQNGSDYNVYFEFTDQNGIKRKIDFATKSTVWHSVYVLTMVLTKRKADKYNNTRYELWYRPWFSNGHPDKQQVEIVFDENNYQILSNDPNNKLIIGAASEDRTGTQYTRGSFIASAIFDEVLDDGAIRTFFNDPFHSLRRRPIDIEEYKIPIMPYQKAVSKMRTLFDQTFDKMWLPVDWHEWRFDDYSQYGNPPSSPPGHSWTFPFSRGYAPYSQPLYQFKYFTIAAILAYKATNDSYYMQKACELLHYYITRADEYATDPDWSSICVYHHGWDVKARKYWPGWIWSSGGGWQKDRSYQLIECQFASGALRLLAENGYDSPTKEYDIAWIKENIIDKWLHIGVSMVRDHGGQWMFAALLLDHLGGSPPDKGPLNPAWRLDLWPRWYPTGSYPLDQLAGQRPGNTYAELAMNVRDVLFRDCGNPNIRIENDERMYIPNDMPTGDFWENSSVQSNYTRPRPPYPERFGYWLSKGGFQTTITSTWTEDFPGYPAKNLNIQVGASYDFSHGNRDIEWVMEANKFCPGFFSQSLVDAMRFTVQNRFYRGTDKSPYGTAWDFDSDAYYINYFGPVILGNLWAWDTDKEGLARLLTAHTETDEAGNYIYYDNAENYHSNLVGWLDNPNRNKWYKRNALPIGSSGAGGSGNYRVQNGYDATGPELTSTAYIAYYYQVDGDDDGDGSLSPQERFIYYSDYFAYAANAGIESSRPLVQAARTVLRADPLTFDYITDAVQSRNYLTNNLQSSYQKIFSEAYSLNYMMRAFFDLADHIRTITGQNIDAFLETNGIKVFPAYANIMNTLGDPVSESNVKEA